MRLTGTDLGMKFDDRTLFSGISFEWYAPSMVAIVGPSGSGKTTLLGILAGSIRPTFGMLRSGSHEARAVRAGWIIQNSPLLVARSAWDNVALGRRMNGAGEVEARTHALDWMAVLSIDHLRDVRVRRLSGGERQRIAVARALASGAPLLLADEPTSSLDARSKHTVASALRSYADAGHLVVMTTHDNEIVKYATNCIAVGDGA